MLPAAARRPWPAPRPRPVGFRPGGVCFCFPAPLDFFCKFCNLASVGIDETLRSRRDSPSCPGWIPTLPRPLQALFTLSVVIFLADTAGLLFFLVSLVQIWMLFLPDQSPPLRCPAAHATPLKIQREVPRHAAFRP
ncbi:hypothetical protein CABS01_14841 [Colletotrichum abscissum]|uniref:uncharacterized protein n=1 Tax=Colletotrichum abscissum TaxID=1671311 RepID=UPI0027D5F5E0|nr:uncharacterized protein CABS01_14841 [Colletotrichum abscissum]KAK1478655.1 hypothetical protein CABS01_14841 [Colletotrichum abscissum]